MLWSFVAGAALELIAVLSGERCGRSFYPLLAAGALLISLYALHDADFTLLFGHLLLLATAWRAKKAST